MITRKKFLAKRREVILNMMDYYKSNGRPDIAKYISQYIDRFDYKKFSCVMSYSEMYAHLETYKF